MMLDAVVIGAGHAGLGVSACLAREGRDHVVLERGRIGETWRTQRWDSFHVNSPNWMNLLPGAASDGGSADAFWRRDEFVTVLERYAADHGLPVRTGVGVTAVERRDGGGFLVRGATESGEQTWAATTVVVASGAQRVPKLPAFRSHLPPSVRQLHSSAYRNPGSLPEGAVAVVGAAQSGCQIAEDLLEAGRDVYLCASRVARVPRRYRGRDILAWWVETRLLDQRPMDLEDPAMRFAPLPQISGVGPRGHTVSLQSLARCGARLLGRVTGVDGGCLVLDGRLGEYVRFADERSAKSKRDIDAWLERTAAPVADDDGDPADAPAPDLWQERGPERLDLAAAGVTSVIWCTGVTGEFGFLRLPVLDGKGMPLHEEGASPEAGLFFVGLPWLRTRKSGVIYGACEDGAHVAAAVGRRLAR